MKSPVRKLLLMLLVLAVASRASATTFSELSDADVRLQEAYLASKLNIDLNNGPPKFPELGPFRVTVHINRVERMIVVDLGSAFASEAANPDMEDVSKNVAVLIELAWPGIEFFNTQLRYGGRDLESLHPELFKPKTASSRRTRRSIGAMAGAGPIVVSAGHGAYYDYKLKKWTTQRDRHNGILEDEITNIFASYLVRHLGDKVNATVATARTFDQNIHEESGYPWSLMAGRYWLRERFPEERSMWNSRPESTESLREKYEDLNSRPLFANHVNARASIAIHTNAAPEANARGARVFYQMGSEISKPLADLALCYMRERVRSEPLYEKYSFKVEGEAANYAELRGANMPAILVEVGFHTNADDAAAMQDDKFQNAAMLGLTKAYRVFAEGGGCDPFINKGVLDQQLVGAHDMTITIGYEGKPTFPIEVRASRYGRGSYRHVVNEPNEAGTITVPWACIGLQSEQIVFYLADADGARTAVKQAPPVTCHHHCIDHEIYEYAYDYDAEHDRVRPCGRIEYTVELFDGHWTRAGLGWNGKPVDRDPVFSVYESDRTSWRKFLEEQAKVDAL